MKRTDAMGFCFTGAGAGLFLAVLFPYRIVLIPMAIVVMGTGYLFLKGHLDFYNDEEKRVDV